jgi:hypothetical protein
MHVKLKVHIFSEYRNVFIMSHKKFMNSFRILKLL